jgi:hypothetical protein
VVPKRLTAKEEEAKARAAEEELQRMDTDARLQVRQTICPAAVCVHNT